MNYYHERKKKGLCVRCGRTKESELVLCDSCREKTKAYVNETRKWYQNMGICPRCGKEKLCGDEKQCPECAAYGYKITMRSRKTERYNENHKEWSRRTHHEAIAKGICTRCRSRRANPGYKTCGVCRERDNEKRRLRNKPVIPKKDRAEMGLCYYCCEPVKPGYKVCQKCYDRSVENSKMTDRENHIWRSMIPRDKREKKVG